MRMESPSGFGRHRSVSGSGTSRPEIVELRGRYTPKLTAHKVNCELLDDEGQ
jgi:hypothetical protein